MKAFLSSILRGLLAMLVCVPILVSIDTVTATTIQPYQPGLSAAFCAARCAFLPIVTRPALASDPRDRQYSLNLYKTIYLTQTPDIGWTGSYNSCNAGTTRSEWKNAIIQRINYFREMAGLPKASLSSAYNQEAQAAAIIMSAQGELSHAPPNSWKCWTQLGKDGAGSSNLYLGVNGPDAITGYMDDYGVTSMGHRRWIIYPQTQLFGTGDIPGDGSHGRSNALHVFDEVNMWGTRPATRDGFVAWPPPVYVPYTVVFAYWTFSYPGADFSGATIRMSKGSAQLSVTRYAQVDGYGENTLVWKVDSVNGRWPKPAGDTAYSVAIDGVKYGGSTHSFNYQVVVFDPEN